jgi:aminopeptidase N
MNFKFFSFLFSVIFFTNLVLAQNQTQPTKLFDLLHTDLNLRPNWQAHTMKGEAVLSLMPYFHPQDTLVLDAKSMDISSVSMVKKTGNVALKFTNNKLHLTIDLDKKYTRKDTIKIKIDYVAIPDSVKDKGGLAISSEKGLYFINTDGKKKNMPTHLWTQGETQANSCWFPTIDHPSEKHTQAIKITYEDKYVSLSNGKLVSTKKNTDGTKTDYWVQKLPHAVYLSVLVIGDFKIVKDKWRDKEVAYYMEPKYETVARPIFGRTPEMIEFFSKKLGVDFPWDKYSQVIVHEYVSGAMENTGAVTFNTMFQKDARELVDGNDDETIAHELFHHWFGDLVTCESWAHLTLNESFANYSEYLWYEHKYGKDEAENHWLRDLSPYFSSATRKQESLIRYDYKKPDDMFDVISYNKGGKILHMLRKYLGDEVFFKSLNVYLTKNAYKTAEYSDLRKAFEEVSGEDLDWYFDQWYLKGGHPTLTSSYKKYTDSTVLFISQKHNFDKSFVYKLPLVLDIYTGDIVKKKSIILDKEEDTIVIYEKDIKCISIDGNNSLVGVKNETRELDDWLHILKNSESFTDQSLAIKKLKNHKSKEKVKDVLFEKLSSDKPRIITAAIRMMDEKWLKQDPKWNQKLIEIATKNQKGSTRAAALDAIGSNDSLAVYKDLVMQKLKDSSYLVEDEALKIYAKIDSLSALEYAKKNITANSFGLLNTVFELISKDKSISNLPLYEKGLEAADGFKKIAVYTSFGKFLTTCPKNIIAEKLVEFEKMIQAKDEVENYCAKSALGSMKGEFAKKEDEISKAKVVEIDAILAKAKSTDED